MYEQNTSSVHSVSDEKTVNLVDIFIYLLRHWKWFLISLLVFGSYFGYQYNKTPFVYSSSITIMIKTPTNTQGAMRLNRYNSFSTPVNVASEMLQFQSKELMRRAIENLNADVSYGFRNKLRPSELYTSSPVKVSFVNRHPEDCCSLSVIPYNEKEVKLSCFSDGREGEALIVKLNDTVNTPAGKLFVSPSIYYSPEWFGKVIKVTKHTRESRVYFFLSRLNTRQLEEDAAIVRLTMTDNSSLRAADMLNMLIMVYNEDAIADKTRVAVSTTEFINSRLEILEMELGEVEKNLEMMRRENEGMDIGTIAGMYLSERSGYKSSLKEMEVQLNLTNIMKQHLKKDINANVLIPNNTGLVDGNIESQIMQYNTTLLRRNRLIEGNSEENPVIQELDQVIQQLKQNIMRSMDNMITGLNIKKEDAIKKENQVLNQIYSMPEKQRAMLSVERQQKIKEDLYIFLLNKQEENALNQAMVDDNARIIDSVAGSNAPAYPSRYRNLLLGLICGMMVPAIILLLLLAFDTRVRSRKDVESALSIPFLGEIPMDPAVSDQEICVSEQGFGMMTEAFRMLRTNLQYMLRSKEPKVISIISFLPGAGKTFIASNLAASLIQMKSRGILVDLDLRKGTLSSRLGSKQGIGITDYLVDESIRVDDIIQRNKCYENLDMIGIGAITPNPTELLLSSRLDALMAELKQSYDYIILDTAPTALIADASVVNRLIDMTIFIIRAGRFDRRLLPDLENQYLQKKWNNMGVALNAVKRGCRGYEYSYGYGYDYGYGYGYGYDYCEKERKTTKI